MNNFIVNSFQVPNALIDELMADMSGNELKCYLIIVRKTKGWQKNEDAISLTQFEKLTKLSRSVIINCCKSLIEKGLIDSKKGHRNITVYWLKNSTSEDSQLVKNINRSSKENELVTSEESEHTKDTIKKQYTKDNKKINKKELDLSKLNEQPTDYVWNDYLEFRKSKRANLTQSALNILINQINLCTDKGISTDAILSECMLRGWQGFKAEWLLKSDVKNYQNNGVDWNSTAWADQVGEVL